MVGVLRRLVPAAVLPCSSGRQRRCPEAVRLLQSSAFMKMVGVAGFEPTPPSSQARRGFNARWEQFDLDEGVWTKPAVAIKQKRPHRVPISGATVQRLQAVRSTVPPDCPWVFPGDVVGGSRCRRQNASGTT